MDWNELVQGTAFWFCTVPIAAIGGAIALWFFTGIINAITGKWEN